LENWIHYRNSKRKQLAILAELTNQKGMVQGMQGEKVKLAKLSGIIYKTMSSTSPRSCLPCFYQYLKYRKYTNSSS
jgi:hypothetical protein